MKLATAALHTQHYGDIKDFRLMDYTTSLVIEKKCFLSLCGAFFFFSLNGQGRE